MTAAVLSHHVTAYAAQVRAHLADLTREQLDDLTDGLEADLMEAFEDPARPGTGEIPLTSPHLGAADVGAAPASSRPDGAPMSVADLIERFGAPATYAEELRAAAGLPARTAADEGKVPRPSIYDRLVSRLRADGELLVSQPARLAAQPWWPGARAVGEALRPLWWVARGWVLFNIVVTMVSGAEDVYFLPKNIFGVLVLLAVVAASIQHGQGHWTTTGRGRHILTAVSVVAAVGFLPVVATASAHSSTIEYYGGYAEPTPVADGVYFGGLPVTNLFVYDADGEFIDQAQIVDDKGRPVRVDREGGLWDQSDGTSRYWSPAEDSYGRDVWNVFPLRMWSDRDAVWDDATQGWVLPEGVDPAATPPPFVQLAPLTEETAPGDDAAQPGAGTASDPGGPAAPTDPAAPVDPVPGDPAPAGTVPADPTQPAGGAADPDGVEVPPAG